MDLEIGRINAMNNSKTIELLKVEHNKFDLFLWQLYQSSKCQYFYLILLFFGVVLIGVTIVDGFKIADSPAFIFFEILLNLTVTLDLAMRVKLNGLSNYIRQNKFWNSLDIFIVVGCNLLFFISLLNHTTLGELSDEFLLVFWLIG
jgi:hypothetical protein